VAARDLNIREAPLRIGCLADFIVQRVINISSVCISSGKIVGNTNKIVFALASEISWTGAVSDQKKPSLNCILKEESKESTNDISKVILS
jgi:hypothetical protein